MEILATLEINKAINDYYNLWISRYDYMIEFDKGFSDRDGYYWNYNVEFETNVPSDFESSKLPFQDGPVKRKEDLIKLTESTLGRNYLRNAIGRDEYGIYVVKVVKSKAINLLALIEKKISKAL